MVKRKKPGRKPTDRIRQHVMLDPDNWEYLRESSHQQGRSLSDQVNWMFRHYRVHHVEADMHRARESLAK